MKDEVPDQDVTPSVTRAELRKKRQVAACSAMLTFLTKEQISGDTELVQYSESIRRDLAEQERLALLWILMDTLPPDYAEFACQQWFMGKGMPGAAIMDDPMADARFWASDANAKELSAYAVACFNRMSAKRQSEFLVWAQKQVETKGQSP